MYFWPLRKKPPSWSCSECPCRCTLVVIGRTETLHQHYPVNGITRNDTTYTLGLDGTMSVINTKYCPENRKQYNMWSWQPINERDKDVFP
jgi:hypothetical protein